MVKRGYYSQLLNKVVSEDDSRLQQLVKLGFGTGEGEREEKDKAEHDDPSKLTKDRKYFDQGKVLNFLFLKSFLVFYLP